MLAIIAGAAIVGAWVMKYYNVNKKPNFSEKYVLYVYPDMSQETILDSLTSGAGMLNRRSMEQAFNSVDGEILPGK